MKYILPAQSITSWYRWNVVTIYADQMQITAAFTLGDFYETFLQEKILYLAKFIC